MEADLRTNMRENLVLAKLARVLNYRFFGRCFQLRTHIQRLTFLDVALDCLGGRLFEFLGVEVILRLELIQRQEQFMHLFEVLGNLKGKGFLGGLGPVEHLAVLDHSVNVNISNGVDQGSQVLKLD